MSKTIRPLTTAALCCLALATLGAPLAAAQQFTGRLDFTVVDATGGVLPGALIEIEGPQSAFGVSSAVGQVSLINLTVGAYSVRISLDGFAPTEFPAVIVETGASVPLRVTLRVGGVAENVQVTAEVPVIDTRKQTSGALVNYDELQLIPTARDPWVVLQTIPGVVVDRVNVGGSESGQQSTYIAKGANDQDNTWYLDGIPITDMAAVGSSAFYYDHDIFEEINIVTGGAEITSQTPGVQLNGTIKSGTNVPHGTFRGYLANESLQSKNLSEELADSIGGEEGEGNRTDQFTDYGFDLGGPLLEDKVWAWGLVARTDIRNLTLTSDLDRTILKNYAFKTTAQLTDRIRGSFLFFGNEKVKDGRGASPTRPPETTWDQTGPTKLYKGEGNFLLRDDLIVTARSSYLDAAFSLTPKGSNPSFLDLSTGIFGGSFVDLKTSRPQWTSIADGNFFRGEHEVKFGYSWRRTIVDSNLTWPGNSTLTLVVGDVFGTGLPLIIGRPLHDTDTRTRGTYFSTYVSDTISKDRLTMNFGARFGRQAIGTDQVSSGAHILAPDIFPALTIQAKNDTHVFNTVTPRTSVSYALGADRNTVVRASYSQFASQLATTDAAFVAGPLYYSYFYAYGIDGLIDGVPNNVADPGELFLTPADVPPGFRGILPAGPFGTYGFDPADPTSTDSPNVVGSGVDAPRTHEVIVGIDHGLFRGTAVDASFSYRRFNGIRWQPLIGIRRGDFEEAGRVTGDLPDGGTFDQPFFAPRSDVVLPAGNGREDINREGYHQRYFGFEANLRKRLSNRWMMRAGFSMNSHREYFTDPSRSIEDPTPIAIDPTLGRFAGEGPLIDGGIVVDPATGSGKSNIYLALPRYQFVANGAYQAPFGINLAANLVTRQGYPQLFNAGNTVVPADSVTPLKNVLVVSDLQDNRLPTVTTLDLRIGRTTEIGQTRIAFDVDIFNLFNASTLLGRQFDVTATGDTGSGKTLEIINPRIARIGLRIEF